MKINDLWQQWMDEYNRLVAGLWLGGQLCLVNDLGNCYALVPRLCAPALASVLDIRCSYLACSCIQRLNVRMAPTLQPADLFPLGLDSRCHDYHVICCQSVPPCNGIVHIRRYHQPEWLVQRRFRLHARGWQCGLWHSLEVIVEHICARKFQILPRTYQRLSCIPF